MVASARLPSSTPTFSRPRRPLLSTRTSLSMAPLNCSRRTLSTTTAVSYSTCSPPPIHSNASAVSLYVVYILHPLAFRSSFLYCSCRCHNSRRAVSTAAHSWCTTPPSFSKTPIALSPPPGIKNLPRVNGRASGVRTRRLSGASKRGPSCCPRSRGMSQHSRRGSATTFDIFLFSRCILFLMYSHSSFWLYPLISSFPVWPTWPLMQKSGSDPHLAEAMRKRRISLHHRELCRPSGARRWCQMNIR